MAQAATLNRSLVVQSFIQRTFSTICGHLSQLKGRTIEQYCENEETVPKYITKFFTLDEKKVIASTTPVKEYDVRLSHKLLKTCCGLKHRNHESWGSENSKDTLECLITFCWTEYLYLKEASEKTDDDLNLHMDKVLEALVLLVKKVEKTKKVDETSLKEELSQHIGEPLDTYDNGPCSQHMYTILRDHLVHQMLVLVYTHLNQLNGMSLSDYLNNKKINLVPRTLFSNERKFLQGNPPPQKMSISILYRVVRRVCFAYDVRRRNCPDNLESILHDLKEEYNTPPRNEEKYTDKCYKVYNLLKNALIEVCNKTGRTRELIIRNLAKEPFVVESFHKSLELPTCSTQCVFSLPKNSHSSEESLVPSTSEEISTPWSVKRTSSVASTLTVEQVNVSVLHKVMCPGGLVPQTLAFVFEALKGDLESLKQNGNGWKCFTSDEKQLITNFSDTSKNMEDLSKKDVTLLCKLLRHGCPLLSRNNDVWLTKSDALEYYITCIKKERNKLAHEVSCITTEELKDILENIENSLVTILEKTESKLADSEHDMKTALQTQRDEVRVEMQKNSEISQALPLEKYLTKTEDMINKVKTDAQDELKQPHLYRESLQCMSPISGSSDPRHKSLTVEEVFMERELEDKDDIKAEGTYKIEDILFCQSNALSSFRTFIIHGRPGDGKTCICKYAFHLWSGNVVESSQKGVDLLIYIPCRFVTDKSLSAYLRERLTNTFGNINRDDIIPLLQELQVLFVIDGFDEAGEEAKGLIHEILTFLPASKLIITTKTQWVPKLIEKVKRVTSCYKVLSMVKMTAETGKQSVRKIFSAMERETEDCNKFLEYLDEMQENLDSLIHRPLTFSLLALLWIEEPGEAKKIRTLTQLYDKLIDLILERVTKQLGKNDSFYCQEWLITLGEVAWDNLKRNKHHLSEQDQTPLKRKARDLELGVEGSKHIVSSLLNCEIHNSLLDNKKSWSFTHNSQQEFFAAKYIVDTLMKDKTTSLSNILELSKETGEKYKKRLQRLLAVIEFIYGLLTIHDRITEARVRELTEIMAVKEPWSFIALEKIFKYLLQKHSQMECVLKSMFMNQEMNTFDGYEPHSTLWVLKNTSLDVSKEVTVIDAVSNVLQIKPLLDYLLSNSHCIKVMVDIDKVSNISSLAEFTEQDRYKDIRFAFRSWKPLCISEVVMKWPYSSPLYLSLHPDVFPLVWWESLMCLLTIKKKVTKVVCSQADQKFFILMKEGATWLNAEIVIDDSFGATDVVIHCKDCSG